MSLKALTEMTNQYGRNTDYVIAAGGNTSYKDSDFLYVKASGTTMGDITEEGFVKLNRSKLSELFEKVYPDDEKAREAAVLKDALAARDEGETKRPSVEALLHDMIPFPYVLHVHSSLVNGITCAVNAKEAFDRLFADEAVWIEAIMPGYILAVKVKGDIAEFRKRTGQPPRLIFIQNHGVFVGGESPAVIDESVAAMEKKIQPMLEIKPDFSEVAYNADFAAAVAVYARMLLSAEQPGVVTFYTNKDVMELVSSRESFEQVPTTYTPDHMVYCGLRGIYVEGTRNEEISSNMKAAIERFRLENNRTPKIIGVKGLGAFCFGETKKEADYVSLLLADTLKIYAYAKNFGGAQKMPRRLIEEINDWEVEAYRRKVSLEKNASKRLSGKISIITGSAQGFGKGIAEEMAAAGAYVVIADLNEEGAKAVAAEITKKFGPGTSIGVKVNVGDENDVKAMVNQTVLSYGGLDIFVSNAGILRAGSLEEIDLASFELMTKVNYTAYYLCAKYASRVMKIQHALKPDTRSDIIQINSKSGLSGSNKNFAYAGGKFGGIGLTQSFALELVEHGVKVNSICPGNFFDGPLWADPEKGLFIQYLKTGKVPGAKTIEDVRKFYEDKVPMKRGCNVKDVARAIFYLVEQEYETGQAVPVTGGQEMLK